MVWQLTRQVRGDKSAVPPNEWVMLKHTESQRAVENSDKITLLRLHISFLAVLQSSGFCRWCSLLRTKSDNAAASFSLQLAQPSMSPRVTKSFTRALQHRFFSCLKQFITCKNKALLTGILACFRKYASQTGTHGIAL